MTVTDPTTTPFELPDELAIDTDAARRIIGEFIRAQLSQAGFDKVLLGLSGGIDSALVAYLAAEAIGPRNVLAVLMPYRTSSPESRGDAEAAVRDLGCPSELVGPDGHSVFRAPPHDEGLSVTQIDPAELRRERIASPLLRDERPEVVIRQLDQIIGERLERNARSAKRP